MRIRTAVVDGGKILVGDDPTYDYVADWRRGQAWTQQELTCMKCLQPMERTAKGTSPLYGTMSEMFRCAGCGAEVSVQPKVEETTATERRTTEQQDQGGSG